MGRLVLVKNDHLPQFKWRLGCISAIHPGSDGVARVALVKTADGELKRAVVNLAPLPLDQ